MKKSDLKKILKPLVTECVKETLIDEGLLSGIISEVARGMGAVSTAPVALKATDEENAPMLERMKRNAFKTEKTQKLQEHKSKLMSAIGASSYNGVDLFEGTTPAHAQQSPAEMATSAQRGDPSDAGVDISNLMGTVGAHWNAHVDEIREGK